MHKITEARIFMQFESRHDQDSSQIYDKLLSLGSFATDSW